MIDAHSFLFAVGDYLVADGQGGDLRVVHGIDRISDEEHSRALVAVTSRTPDGQAITLLLDPEEATLAACHICTMAHSLRMAA